MDSYWNILCLQEFGLQTSFELLDTSNGVVYVFPGISKQSRSNAIAVSHQLAPHVGFHCFCSFGGLIAFNFGGAVIVVGTLHVPHSNHEVSLDQACGELDVMFDSLLKHVTSVWKVLVKHVRFVIGADLNCELHNPNKLSQRRTDMLAWFAEKDISPISPSNSLITSHNAWGNQHARLIDYLLVDNTTLPNCDNLRNCTDLLGIAHSDHQPMCTEINLVQACKSINLAC